MNINNLKAVILSHYHFDHVGNPALLAKSTDLVVGPGFKDRFCPGYPTKKYSQFWEEAFQGRNVDELEFDDELKIGNFQAKDYFGDGSFYVLNTPGHTTGHNSALVHTTSNPDTFIFLGGDACHITGSVRPSPYAPLPEHIPEATALDKRIPKGCPCSAFTSSHRDSENSRTSPFYVVSTHKNCVYEDIPVSEETIEGMKPFDADPNILISIAHDPTGLDVFDFFPKGTANDWKRKGWKEQMHWGFLSELPYNGKTVHEPLVDGLYENGKRLRDLEFNWVSKLA